MKKREVLRDAIFAGMCISFGGFASAGLPKPINGIIFSAGLVMIIFLQLQLFTGNILRAKDGFSWKMLFKYWGWVYIGNFIGCFLSAWVIILSGLNLDATSSIANTLNTTFYNSLSSDEKDFIDTVEWVSGYANYVGFDRCHVLVRDPNGNRTDNS